MSQPPSDEYPSGCREVTQSRVAFSGRGVQSSGSVELVTLSRAKRYGNDHGMVKRNRRPGERSAQEKLKAVIEFEGLEGEKQGEYLRREGLHSDHIAAWKKSMEAGLEPGRGDNPSTRMERSQVSARRGIEKDSRGKDRALAETTSLLVLKKKRT